MDDRKRWKYYDRRTQARCTVQQYYAIIGGIEEFENVSEATLLLTADTIPQEKTELSFITARESWKSIARGTKHLNSLRLIISGCLVDDDVFLSEFLVKRMRKDLELQVWIRQPFRSLWKCHMLGNIKYLLLNNCEEYLGNDIRFLLKTFQHKNSIKALALYGISLKTFINQLINTPDIECLWYTLTNCLETILFWFPLLRYQLIFNRNSVLASSVLYSTGPRAAVNDALTSLRKLEFLEERPFSKKSNLDIMGLEHYV